jgi:hypothetical protein
MFKVQPIELIRAYFGENVALYFVYLGWYTYMLILPSIIGCIVVGYSIINTFFDIPTLDTCNGKELNRKSERVKSILSRCEYSDGISLSRTNT